MNCTDLGDLSSIVPTDERLQVAITSAPQVIVQALPVTLGLLLWIVLELARRKRAASDRVRRVIRVLTLLCTLAIALVAWRFTTVVTCQVSHQSVVWNILAVAGLVGTSTLVLFAIGLRRPRLAVLTSLLIASGVVVADVGLRGWWNVDARLAAQHLMPVQFLWVLHAIAVLFHLNRTAVSFTVSTTGTSTKRRALVEVVDALAHRAPTHSSPGGACSERGRERSNLRV